MSKVLHDLELKCHIVEKQEYALVRSLKHFRTSIGYSKVIGYFSNSIVKDVLSQVEGIGVGGRWVAKTHEYNVEIKPTKLIKG